MRDQSSIGLAASPWVRRFVTGVASGGQALDVACGGGRHIALLRAAGLEVMGIDRNIGQAAAQFRDDPGVSLVEADLESGAAPPFAGHVFSAVVVTNYLWRPLLAAIVDAVSDQGLLIYETFAVGNERFGRPANPDFLLRPAELLDAVRPRLVPVAYEHVRLAAPDRIVQRICAAGRGHPWLVAGAPADTPQPEPTAT